jgi:isopenicillin N synthase-like dioxygenase
LLPVRTNETIINDYLFNKGLDENYFVDRHRFMFQDQDKNATTFRTLYYPSLSASDIQPGVVRCGAHSDYGTVTLLLQDGVGGLEVILCSFVL